MCHLFILQKTQTSQVATMCVLVNQQPTWWYHHIHHKKTVSGVPPRNTTNTHIVSTGGRCDSPDLLELRLMRPTDAQPSTTTATTTDLQAHGHSRRVLHDPPSLPRM